jgi:hypothetical protein
LTDSDLVTFFDTESRRDVCGKVLMSLLVSGVFGNEVKVFSADDQGSVHLGRDDGAGEDTASDRDHTGERAFLVCIRTHGQHNVNFTFGRVPLSKLPQSLVTQSSPPA